MSTPTSQASISVVARRVLVGILARLERMQYFNQALVWLAQTLIFAAAMLAAYLLRFDFTVPPHFASHLRLGVLVCVLVKPVVFRLYKLDRGWWRFVSVHDASRLTLANAVASAASASVILLLMPHGFPRSIYIIDFFLSLIGTGGARVFIRLVVTAASSQIPPAAKRVIIYGAGAAGLALAHEIRTNPALGYEVQGFIDDNRRKADMRLHGLRVYGCGAGLPELVTALRVQEILIAIPSASRMEMNQVLASCERANVKFRTVPALSELVEGHGLAAQIRDVAVEDLLGRLPVRLELPRIGEILAQQVVLVTGAAGSIGSELCRQIARFRPAGIFAFDLSESPLFELQQSMQRLYPGIRFEPRVGSIQNMRRLREILAEAQPAAVYHAAAYKHVPMMEMHLFEAIENNILGTRALIRAVVEAEVPRFVLISSDKAVRPQSIMGVTKRVAELLIASQWPATTRFVAVRFGNVLGSNGSVVPTFKRQIAQGGPITVTHPDMTRFFMTIPEACQLVLQASAMGRGSEIYVLDMGEPVKIVDLARKLILLTGHRPGSEIRIEFTGIRPGEKLFEELNSSSEQLQSTQHEKIRVFAAPTPSPESLEASMDALQLACAERNEEAALRLLIEMVPDFTPARDLSQAAPPLAAMASRAGSFSS